MTEEHQSDQAGTFGELYQFSEHKVGDSLTYRDDDGAIITGQIVWVVPPLSIPAIGNRRPQELPAHYLVVSEQTGGFPEVVTFSQVVEH